MRNSRYVAHARNPHRGCAHHLFREEKKLKGGKRKNIGGSDIESFLFRKATYRGHSTRLIHVGICYWTVISNGSYGHLNNHLAHPPSLNPLSLSLPLFLNVSLPRASLSPFLGNLADAIGRRAIEEKRLALSSAFHFFTVTPGRRGLAVTHHHRPE